VVNVTTHGEFWNFVQAEEAQALGIEIVILFDLYSLFDVDSSRVIIDFLLLFIHLFSLSFLGSEILCIWSLGWRFPSEKW
jgi:hypothetical protein